MNAMHELRRSSAASWRRRGVGVSASVMACAIAGAVGVIGIMGLQIGAGPGQDSKAPKPSIAVIPKGTTHEFWKTVQAGALKGGAEAGVEVVWKGPVREDDRDEQIKVVENLVTRGVKGIVIAPLDDRALVPCLRDAQKAGIPVVIFDSGLQWDGQKSFVATDNAKGGELAAKELGRLLGGKGKVVMMRYVEGSASTGLREKGFLDTLKKEFPGVTVVSSDQFGGATVESCYRTAENLLNKYKEIDGVYAPNEPTSYAFMKALVDSGRSKKVKFVGFDASEKLVKGLEDGAVDALVVQNPYRMGRLAVETMGKVLKGEKVPAFVDTGCTLVTKANMKEPAINEVLHPPIGGAKP